MVIQISTNNSIDAIGAITAILYETLKQNGIDVVVGSPKQDKNNQNYLFLYEIDFDPHLKNITLEKGFPPPIWLTLRYLLIGIEDNDKDYTPYRQMGNAIRCLNDINFISFSSANKPWIIPALEHNPEPLKITFDSTPYDLLSKILGDVNSRYQFSIGFQIRPIIIFPEASFQSSPYLVGINYKDQNKELKYEDAVKINVSAEMFKKPFIKEIVPNRISFENNKFKFTFKGSRLDLSNPKIDFGFSNSFEPIKILNQSSNEINCEITPYKNNECKISAGSYPFRIIELKNNNKFSYSNTEVVHILPFIKGKPKIDNSGRKLTIIGSLLGSKNDAISLGIWQNGKILMIFSNFEINPSDNQKELRLELPEGKDFPSENFRIVLRINGEQANQFPLMEVS